MNALFNKFDGLNIKYIVEDKVVVGNRKLFFDMKVEHEGNVFFIESDGKQHFDVSATMKLAQTKDKEKGLKRFKEQRTRDLLKEDYIMGSGKLLFRISYRQLKYIPKLVDEMLEVSKRGEKGVSYMDSIYFDWELIE
mgnify:CR=1 FL=1